MPNAADNLVKKYPDRISQLKGPVLDYLKKIQYTKSGKVPYNGTEQDLYMAVFYPDYRRVSPTKQFPADVLHDNPGIKTPKDYMTFVNRAKSVEIKPSEWTALKEVAKTLNVPYDSLYRLINFESGWRPDATNPRSGARGLIQFMPSTAAWLGFKKSMGITTILIAATAVWWFFLRKKVAGV